MDLDEPKQKLKQFFSFKKSRERKESPTAAQPTTAARQELDADTLSPAGQSIQPDEARAQDKQPNEDPSTNPPKSDTSIFELWNLAYEKLREEDGELIAGYEARLHGKLDKAVVARMGTKLNTWKLKFRETEVQLKDLVQPVVGVVKWVDQYVTTAIGSNPSAALAWAGVSLLLPFFLNHPEQGISLGEGLEEICSLIAQSRMREDLYARRYESKTSDRNNSSTHIEYKNALELLYRKILKFQITAYCYYDKSTAVRLGLDSVKWNDWNTLLDGVRKQERIFTEFNEIWRDAKYDEEWNASKKQHQGILRHLDSIGADISAFRKAVDDKQAERQRQELLDWLCDIDPSQMYNAARSKHQSGTSEWLVKDNKELKIWEKSPGSLLWLHGKAGSGKSMLSSSVIQYLRERESSTSDPYTVLAYFYFGFSDVKRQTVDGMLASLIKQICSRRPDTPDLVESLRGYMRRGERPDTEKLEAALKAAVRGFSAIHIVIDGLDECPIITNEQDKLMRSFKGIAKARIENVHIFCTSRLEPRINAALTPLLSWPSRVAINLTTRQEAVNRDIGVYIDSQLASEEYSSWSGDIKAEARMSLIKKADGMFQYIYHQFEALKNLSTTKDIRAALDGLSDGLDATYTRVLQNIDVRYRDQVINSLKWLAFSNHDFSLESFAEIFILRPNAAVVVEECERLFKAEDVLKYLSDLVVTQSQFRRSGTLIRLAHFSVKEFLVSERIAEGPAACFRLDEMDAHLHIAYSCLVYHLHCSTSDENITSDMDLSGWGTVNWAQQLEMVPRKLWPTRVSHAARRALAIGSPSLRQIIKVESRTGWMVGGYDPHMVRQPQCYAAYRGFLQLFDMISSQATGENNNSNYWTKEDIDTALPYAAYRGSTKIVELLLQRGADTNAESEEYGDALQAAAGRGHISVVKLLLDGGAEINMQRGISGSALQAAARGDHLDVLKLLVSCGGDIDLPSNQYGCVLTSAVHSKRSLEFLLDSGADINRRGMGNFGTALVKAVYGSRTGDGINDSVRLLLERGANVNMPAGDSYGYPLQAACVYERWMPSSTAIAKFLLDKGADVNAQGGIYNTALQVACFGSNLKAVKLLLDRGADVNLQGGEYGTALQAACAHEYGRGEEIIKLLLEKGADVNARGGEYGSALQAACHRQSVEAVQLLLDRGADVNLPGGRDFKSALQAAACSYHGALEKVQLLISRGADINPQGRANIDAAFLAAVAGQTDCWQLLLDHRANVNNASSNGETALQIACSRSLMDTANLLITQYGADVHIQSSRGSGSAWHRAASAGAIAYHSNDKEYEAELRAGNILLQLMLNRGVDVNDSRGLEHATALEGAFHLKLAEERIRFLLDRGADVNIKAGKYGFPLQAACAIANCGSVTKFLLDNCSDVDVNAQGGKFGSALQAAAHSGQTESIKLLLDRGADANALGGKYGSVLQAAAHNGDTNLVKFLLDKGADADARGGEYGSVLNAAVTNGWWEIVKLLLDHHVKIEKPQLPMAEEEWLRRMREEFGRGAIERYTMFWDKEERLSRGIGPRESNRKATN